MKRLLMAAALLLPVPACAQFSGGGGSGGSVALTPATPTSLGGVKCGTGTTCATDGTLTGVTGAAGAPGAPGQGFTYRGSWAASTAYNPYDVLTNAGQTYEVTTAFTSGSTFSATNMVLWAAQGAAGSGGSSTPATSSVLGGIKCGTGTTCAGDGTLTVAPGLSTATYGGTSSINIGGTAATATYSRQFVHSFNSNGYLPLTTAWFDVRWTALTARAGIVAIESNIPGGALVPVAVPIFYSGITTSSSLYAVVLSTGEIQIKVGDTTTTPENATGLDGSTLGSSGSISFSITYPTN